MATIHKFVYVMILIVFQLLVVTECLPHRQCTVDSDCPNICHPPKVPRCFYYQCFCHIIYIVS
uniref:Nodule cysteine-rich protein 4 n=1 Tax=Cicer arietinum TaxID=3827 RepID=A0A0U8TC29_CICAR|nr:TPA_exp: nodule cysteine-rich protein 4 [Cicer arietinum]